MLILSNSDCRICAEALLGPLEASDQLDSADELKDWLDGFYSSPSEYLGELRIILKRIGPKSLDFEACKNVKDCLRYIDNAFKRVNG